MLSGSILRQFRMAKDAVIPIVIMSHRYNLSQVLQQGKFLRAMPGMDAGEDEKTSGHVSQRWILR